MMIARYMQEFADRAASVLGSRISVSITLRHHGMMLRTASSDERSARCDQVEARHEQGPCLTAMGTMMAQRVLDLPGDDRWPRWALHTAGEGFTSVIAVPAPVQPGIEVALNLYSELADPWTRPLVEAARSYVNLLAATVRIQIELAGVDDDYAGRYSLLGDEVVVNWAVGAVMVCNRCTDEQAQATLTAASERRGVALREVAESVLRALAPERLASP